MITPFEIHLEQANHNIDLFNDLNSHFPKDYADWKVTVAFYAALHLAHAFVARQLDQLARSLGSKEDYLFKYNREKQLTRTERAQQNIDLDLTSHTGFLNYINPHIKTNQTINIDWRFDDTSYSAYQYLYNQSRVARYLESKDFTRLTSGFTKSEGKVTAGHVKKARNKLNTIREFLNTKFQTTGQINELKTV